MRCDVLIVGGGPAGLTAAIALRRRGVDVLLADAQSPPIDKACGEGIMPDSRRDLARLGVELPSATGAVFHGIRFCDERSSVYAKFPAGQGLGIRRTALHQLLTDHAADAGVRLAWKSVVTVKQGSPVNLNGQPVTYKYLIGADGQTSRVRSWAGLDRGSLLTSRLGFRIHYRIAPWSRNVEVYWGACGQAYVTPVAGNEVCVSVMTRAAHNRTRSHDIVESIPELRSRLIGAAIITSERGAITTTRRLKHVVRNNVALVGDASGSADAITGEGLALAFRQAHLAAAAIEVDDLSIYENTHPSVMRLPQSMARFMLLMDRWPLLRKRVLRTLANDPALFESMLHVHLGETPIRKFLVQEAPAFGLRLLLPA